MTSENEKLCGCWVRQCRGHYHITCEAGDLIYGSFDTQEEAERKLEQLAQSWTVDDG